MKDKLHKSVKVLDHGFIRLIDSMGDDLSISRNARVSYDAEWRAGEDEGSDKRLINYLYKNGHNTPFEAVSVTIEVKAPIFVFRQWHRHRTQCITGDSRISFLSLGNNKQYTHTIKELYDRWNTNKIIKRKDKQKRSNMDFQRSLIRSKNVFCTDENNQINLTKINNIVYSGKKKVFGIIMQNGRQVEASKDHRFLTDKGWRRLEELVVGDKLSTLYKGGHNIKDKNFPTLTTDELSNEEWKDISGCIGFEVSNLGRIRSIFLAKGNSLLKNKEIRKITKTKNNRAVISLPIGLMQISAIVAGEFLDGYGECVLHKNDNALDNRLDNLYYGTNLDNARDRRKNNINQKRKIVFDKITAILDCGEKRHL